MCHIKVGLESQYCTLHVVRGQFLLQQIYRFLVTHAMGNVVTVFSREVMTLKRLRCRGKKKNDKYIERFGVVCKYTMIQMLFIEFCYPMSLDLL